MAFDVLRSYIGTFASKASNELESDVKGCEREFPSSSLLHAPGNGDRIPEPVAAKIRDFTLSIVQDMSRADREHEVQRLAPCH